MTSLVKQLEFEVAAFAGSPQCSPGQVWRALRLSVRARKTWRPSGADIAQLYEQAVVQRPELFTAPQFEAIYL
jgi:hypothetical protein